MRAISHAITTARTRVESLRTDHELIEHIKNEMSTSCKEVRPIDAWINAGTPRDKKKAPSSLPIDELMRDWLGYGAKPISQRDVFWYYDFLKATDNLDIMSHYFADENKWMSSAHELRVADLGTILDINLSTAFLPLINMETLYIAEIGGGYGRLADAFINVFPGQIRYLLIDSVPASLWFSYEYMRSAHPDINTGFYFNGDELDFDRFDCYILPSWRIDLVQNKKFDLVINIQSMQEMDQHNVDYYIRWFDEALKSNGIAYLANRRDHIFRGDWNYPAHWECLLKTPTPRSWLRDFPAEIYKKQDRNYISQNTLNEALYRMQLHYSREHKLAAAKAAGYLPY